MSDSQVLHCVYRSSTLCSTNEQIICNSGWSLCVFNLRYQCNPFKDMLKSDLKINGYEYVSSMNGLTLIILHNIFNSDTFNSYASTTVLLSLPSKNPELKLFSWHNLIASFLSISFQCSNSL